MGLFAECFIERWGIDDLEGDGWEGEEGIEEEFVESEKLVPAF